MKIVVSFLFLVIAVYVNAQTAINVVPVPAEVTLGHGNFILDKKTVIYYNRKETILTCILFNNWLEKNYGLRLAVKYGTEYELIKISNSGLFLFIDEKKSNAETASGSYSLNIDRKNIIINADEENGLFYGIQTLMQLLPSVNNKTLIVNNRLFVPQLFINDYPRFPYRGMHLDVSRHFQPVAIIKKYIDYLATYKFNTFHWHLTDDQGWRIEIKKFPLLTQIGAYRNGTITGHHPGNGNTNTPYGGFYTQQEIKEIVKYAAERYITIIPEIDLPGHSSAAIAAYPQLSCFPDENTNIQNIPWAGSNQGKQVQQTWGVFDDVLCPNAYTINFFQNVLDEVMQLFPSKYIHIGGDECPKEAWKRSAFCRQLITENNLKDEHGLQSYFIHTLEKYIDSKGRKIIGWDEILEGGLAPDATVMSWRGEDGGVEAVKQEHDVIMTPGSYCYLDHSQSRNEDSLTIGGYLPLDKIYSYEPVPSAINAKQSKHILGAQANVWTEYIDNAAKLEYMIFPRMIAMSEVLWSPKEKRNWKDFERRLPQIFERLDEQKINYSKAYYDLIATVLPAKKYEGILWNIESAGNNPVLINFGNSDSAWKYDGPQLITNGNFMATANSYINGHPLKIAQEFSINKATGKKIVLTVAAHKNHPGDGAFTLVNGVQNKDGFVKENEFMGFLGNDMDAVIDLGIEMPVSKIVLHTLRRESDGIFLPSELDVSFLPFMDSSIPKDLPHVSTSTVQIVKNDNNIMLVQLPELKNCRYIRVLARNIGKIPTGKSGAGTPAWLFADEIEIE